MSESKTKLYLVRLNWKFLILWMEVGTNIKLGLCLYLVNPSSVGFLSWIPASTPSGPGVLAINLVSPNVTSDLVLPETRHFGDHVWELLMILCFLSTEWLLLSLNTTVSSFSLAVSNWPLASHSSWTCPSLWHLCLRAECYKRHKHTPHRRSVVWCWLSRNRWNRI